MKDNPLIRKRVYVTGEKQEHPKIWWPIWKVLELKLAPILNMNRSVSASQIDLRDQLEQLGNMAKNQSKVISQLYKETAELTNRLANVEEALTTLLKSTTVDIGDLNVVDFTDRAEMKEEIRRKALEDGVPESDLEHVLAPLFEE